MDRTLTRRRLLGTGAAMAAAAALPPFPYPAGVGPAPVADDTTTTELTTDDRAWMAKRVTRDERGQRVVGTRDRTVPRQWPHIPAPLHIRSDSASYHPVLEFLRRSEAHRQTWQVPDAVQYRTEWIWQVPEPFRVAFQGFAEDIASVAELRIHTALSNVLYGHIEDAAGVNVGDYDDDEYEPLTEAQTLEVMRTPTTIGAVLLAICEDMQMDPRDWLNEHDLALLQQAT